MGEDLPFPIAGCGSRDRTCIFSMRLMSYRYPIPQYSQGDLSSALASNLTAIMRYHRRLQTNVYAKA